ncbi:hypothetical protein GQX73_g3982 [Xylaria multiplex]|uniref:Uncharacterized protein n=1 Tax=Xylaria multiplex TaxID=323545 RepID=A0A7C8IQB1_9PEZI|nr:hypothetical protein GQX73_g3982 [Xylaria multiplex]
MADLPSQHPNLALHLTDRALTPLITSGRDDKHLDSLASLSHTALSAHESAQRLGLGTLQRIMVEHDDDGPVLLQTFLSPYPPTPISAPQPATGAVTAPQLSSQDSRPNPRQHKGALALAAESRGASAFETTHLRGGAAQDDDDDDYEEHEHTIFLGDSPAIDDEDENPNTPPMLVGIAVGATSDDALEARRAAARLERVGREIQGRWSDFQGLSPAPRGRRREDELEGDSVAAD